ncbi:response regulator [Actibacterium sp.]|uniref:response regulator n=1 Tax=Actibacterium sp. TaxID=1872125 RepID=UPI003561F58D
MKTLVYLLEDDPDISRLIRRTLEQQSFQVEEFRRQEDFERAFAKHIPDLCLIDLILPDGDGLPLIADKLRGSGVPTIIVTGRGNLTDKVVGLEIGADDYIVKPFEPRELVARVRAVLRRTRPTDRKPAAATKRSFAQFGEWTADFDGCTLIDEEGTRIRMSAAETALLTVLVKSAGRVLSRSQLLDLSAPKELEPFDRSMDARISRLRRKLRDDPRSPRIIRTVYGAGYVFTLEVAWTDKLPET